jgi:uncharacterized membrane protein
MTLLALDLRVPPDIGHVSEHMLVHELHQRVPSYLSFAISFFIISGYWGRHRRLMRSVERVDDTLIGQTLLLLFCVAVLPFPAALLGQFGSHAIALVIYGSVNLVAALSLLRLHRIVRSHHLVSSEAMNQGASEVAELFGTITVFALCIPAGYVLPHNGAWVLVLIPPAQRWHQAWRFVRNRWARRTRSADSPDSDTPTH